MHYDAKLSCYTLVYAWFIWAGGVDDDLNGLVVVIGTHLDTSELNSFPTVFSAYFTNKCFSIFKENPKCSCLRSFRLVIFPSRCTMSSSCHRRKRASSTAWGTLSSVQSLWWPKGSRATPAGTASPSLLSTVGLIHCRLHRSVIQHHSADSWELRK